MRSCAAQRAYPRLCFDASCGTRDVAPGPEEEGELLTDIVRDGTAEWNRTTDPQIHNLVL